MWTIGTTEVNEVLKERFEQLRGELGLTNPDLCQLAGLALSTIPTWGSRSEKGEYPSGMPGEGMLKFCGVFGMNPGWFLSDGNDYERWSPELVAARRALRKWARTATHETTRERLVAVWEQLQALAPSFRRERTDANEAASGEEIWAMYLYWVNCERRGVPNAKPVGVHMDDWLACKQGRVNPGEMQLKGAALLTGLPVKWLATGDVQYIREVDLDDAKRLLEVANGLGLDVEDVLRFAQIGRTSLR
jgi:hypothetical protein